MSVQALWGIFLLFLTFSYFWQLSFYIGPISSGLPVLRFSSRFHQQIPKVAPVLTDNGFGREPYGVLVARWTLD
jgi:hypothetical protein